MPAKLKFHRDTREALERAYNAEWIAKHGTQGELTVDHPEIIYNRRVFIDTLESFAKSLEDLKAIMPPPQRERKRNLVKLATALNNLSAQLDETDSGAIAYVLSLAIPRIMGQAADEITKLDFLYAGDRMPAELGPIVSAFYQAATQAAKDLPPITVKERKDVAMALVRHVAFHGFPVSVTPTGFTGQCWRAVNDAAGMDAESSQYWLEQARAEFQFLGI